MTWEDPPETVTWTFDPPIGGKYPSITLRAPTAGEVLKATAVKGISSLEATLRLIEFVSAERVPWESLRAVKRHIIEQMDRYMDLFGATPYPGPLDDWLKRRAAAEAAEAAKRAQEAAEAAEAAREAAEASREMSSRSQA